MPYLDRNKVKSYKLDLGEVTNPNQLTIKYPYEKKTPHYLVKFIWMVHERRNLKPLLPFSAYVNHIKAMLKEVSEDEVIALILKAAEVSNYPFTVKFLRRLHEENTDNPKTK